MLAEALGNLLQAQGVTRNGAQLTGPELILAAETATEHLRKPEKNTPARKIVANLLRRERLAKRMYKKSAENEKTCNPQLKSAMSHMTAMLSAQWAEARNGADTSRSILIGRKP
jgi:hypothetical protein